MDTVPEQRDLGLLSKLELVSRYINGYYSLDAETRSRFEAAFKERKLPLPDMPKREEARARGPEKAAAPMDKSIFISYFLLIYSGTAIFYSWIYLAERLFKLDFRENAKHRLIQSGIALFYVLVELIAIECLAAPD